MAASHLHLARGPAAGESDSPTASPIRVVLADGHELMQRGLRLLLDEQPDMEVVAEADDLAGVVRCVDRYRPNVLVFDLDTRGGSGATSVDHLRERRGETEIVAMTMRDDPVFAKRAFAAGALGFVTKDLADVELPQAVRAAACGQEYVSPHVAERLGALQRSLTGNVLTARGVEVLRLTSLGHTSVEIARKLHVTVSTIETHRARIYGRLGLTTRAQLVRYSLRRGLIGDRAPAAGASGTLVGRQAHGDERTRRI